MGSHDALYYLTFIPAILLAVTFHEFAHARVALAFGDRTAELEGRVSLNPLVHLDPIGTIGMIFGGFGWGKPVPVNRSYLRHPRADLLVSAAGPATNFLLAIAVALPYHVPFLMAGLDAIGAGTGARILLPVIIYINLGLGFFNFLPIGPLDGSHVLENLLPLNLASQFHDFNRTYGWTLLIGLIILDNVTSIPVFSFLSVLVRSAYSLLLGA